VCWTTSLLATSSHVAFGGSHTVFVQNRLETALRISISYRRWLSGVLLNFLELINRFLRDPVQFRRRKWRVSSRSNTWMQSKLRLQQSRRFDTNQKKFTAGCTVLAGPRASVNGYLYGVTQIRAGAAQAKHEVGWGLDERNCNASLLEVRCSSDNMFW
jgi:hypothetical protein